LTERVRLDFGDRATWDVALGGCDMVFLLRPPAIANVAETLNPFIDAAYATGVQHVVFLSVLGADKMSWVPHHKVERHLIACKRSWTLLRPGFFAQNLQDAYAQDIREDDRIYVPSGNAKVAFLDVADIGSVVARNFESPAAYAGRALTLTGPQAVTFDEVAQLLSARLHRVIRYDPASIAGYAWHLRRKRDLPWMQILVQTFLHVGLRRGDAEQVDDTIEQILGRPARSVAEYIERFARRAPRFDAATSEMEGRRQGGSKLLTS
jgi:uncharacterized protein YbjT (DUF2867 family)